MQFSSQTQTFMTSCNKYVPVFLLLLLLQLCLEKNVSTMSPSSMRMEHYSCRDLLFNVTNLKLNISRLHDPAVPPRSTKTGNEPMKQFEYYKIKLLDFVPHSMQIDKHKGKTTVKN